MFKLLSNNKKHIEAINNLIEGKITIEEAKKTRGSYLDKFFKLDKLYDIFEYIFIFMPPVIIYASFQDDRIFVILFILFNGLWLTKVQVEQETDRVHRVVNVYEEWIDCKENHLDIDYTKLTYISESVSTKPAVILVLLTMAIVIIIYCKGYKETYTLFLLAMMGLGYCASLIKY